jgi:hypothetical protein
VGSLLTFDIPQTALVATLDTYDFIFESHISIWLVVEPEVRRSEECGCAKRGLQYVLIFSKKVRHSNLVCNKWIGGNMC